MVMAFPQKYVEIPHLKRLKNLSNRSKPSIYIYIFFEENQLLEFGINLFFFYPIKKVYKNLNINGPLCFYTSIVKAKKINYCYCQL